ncbi:MAG: chemotaxis protein CheW [Geobacteraceae bacterium]
MSDEILEIQVACFQLGDDLYAVDIMRIREIIRPQKLTLLPRAPAFVEGIINLRGAVIPVIDMRRRFGLPPRPVVHTSRLLIVTIAGQLIGLVVDDVTEVLTIPVRDIKPPPKVVGGVGAEYLVGVCLEKDSLIMLLNLDRILTAGESDELGLLDGSEK